MLIEFCLPTSGKTVPSGRDWIHEVKYDGYRLRLERDGDRVRLFTRGGHDWAGRYPWIAETARKIRKTQFIIDGEAVVLGVDGISDFNPCTPASTTTKSSSTPSTAWRSAGTICAGCRYTCARPT
jgi:ATP-dependent DNA ligase